MEMVRHRLFSYTMESTRFVNGEKTYPEGLEFIYPTNLSAASESWERAMSSAEKEDLQMIHDGVRPQEARSVLPNAVAASIAVTGNCRNWRHMFLMRTSKESHPDFRAVSIPL